MNIDFNNFVALSFCPFGHSFATIAVLMMASLSMMLTTACLASLFAFAFLPPSRRVLGGARSGRHSLSPSDLAPRMGHIASHKCYKTVKPLDKL